jgi:hypothetical protein
MKSEIKVELSNKIQLDNLIRNAYFSDGQMGKLLGQKNYIEITPEVDDIFHTVVRGLDKATIKVINPDLIDGNLRCLVIEDGSNIKIYPINTYCIVLEENNKYSFY